MDIKVQVDSNEAIEDWSAFREAMEAVAEQFDCHLGTIWHVGVGQPL